MNFAGTEGSIKNLRTKSKISLDELFEMLLVVVTDVMEHNGAEGIDEIDINDSRAFLRDGALPLGEMFLQIFKRDDDSIISSVSSSAQEEYRQLISQFGELIGKIREVRDEIKNAESKRDELAQKQEELEVERGPLVKIAEECDQIQGRIDFLSDPLLDNAEETKKQLQSELEQRQSRFDSLKQDKEKIEASLKKIQIDIDSIDSDIKKLNDKIKRLTEDKKIKEEDKNGLEQGLQNLKDKVAKLDAWLRGYPELSRKINEECQLKSDEQKDKQAEISVIFNAFTSSFNDEFLKATLYRNKDSLCDLSIENYPDLNLIPGEIKTFEELKECISSISARVEGLISVLENALGKIIEESKKFTSD